MCQLEMRHVPAARGFHPVRRCMASKLSGIVAASSQRSNCLWALMIILGPSVRKHKNMSCGFQMAEAGAAFVAKKVFVSRTGEACTQRIGCGFQLEGTRFSKVCTQRTGCGFSKVCKQLGGGGLALTAPALLAKSILVGYDKGRWQKHDIRR